jgi:hypothetical protein
MYGAAETKVAMDPRTPLPVQKMETVGQVINTSISTLVSCRSALDALLQKYLGPRPSDNAKCPEPPQPCLRSDVDSVRSLANVIERQITELHEILGY